MQGRIPCAKINQHIIQIFIIVLYDLYIRGYKIKVLVIYYMTPQEQPQEQPQEPIFEPIFEEPTPQEQKPKQFIEYTYMTAIWAVGYVVGRTIKLQLLLYRGIYDGCGNDYTV